MSTGETIQSIRALLLQSMSGEALSESSLSRLQQWLDSSAQNQLLLDQLKSDHWLAEELDKINKVDTAGRWQEIAKKLHENRVGEIPASMAKVVPLERPVPDRELIPAEKWAPLRRIPHWRRWRIAASVLVLLGIAGLGIGKWRGSVIAAEEALIDHLKDSAGMAASAATLQLADGSVIVLDDTHKQLSETGQGNRIIQQEGHRLVYMPATNSGPGGPDEKEAYHILRVPHGMQFELVLGDGTKVWLNDESSLRYPVSFDGRQRDLELRGEAYFEVTKSENAPFRVRTSSLMTVVLGTHFNVRDYPAEHQPRTTLLEGRVIVRKGNETATLDIAGQEAQIREGVPGLEVVPVSLETRIAWKSGYFYFDHHDIRTSLEEVARWYKKKLVFRDHTETAQLGEGQVTRNQPLRQLLENIERPDLHFQYGDSTIIVSRQ